MRRAAPLALAFAVSIGMFIAAIALAGCGDIMIRYNQSISTAAVTASTCRDTLSEVSEKRVAACAEKLKDNHKEEAQMCLLTWKVQHEKVNQACRSLKIGARIALEAAPLVEAGVNKKKNAIDWIVRLAKATVDVIATMKDAGIEMPTKGAK